MCTSVWTLVSDFASIRVPAIFDAINIFLKKGRSWAGSIKIQVVPKWQLFLSMVASHSPPYQGKWARDLWVSTMAAHWNHGAALQNNADWVPSRRF